MSKKQHHNESADVPGDFVKGVSEGPIDTESDRPQRSADEHLQALADERDAAKDQLLRLQAELENFRKRVQRDQDQERRYAAMSLVRDLLPGLDNLQRALDAARHTDDHSAMLQGVEMVASQIGDILTRHGIEAIPALGKPFDPNRHDAIQQMASADHPPMTIIDEIERGYTLHDRVIRPSKVIVAVMPPEADAAE